MFSVEAHKSFFCDSGTCQELDSLTHVTMVTGKNLVNVALEIYVSHLENCLGVSLLAE